MSKRNRPTTAVQMARRTRRHAYRTAYNSPEGKAARAAAANGSGTKAAPAKSSGIAAPKPAKQT
ncbi:MAG: hypothetical protein ABUL77_02395 [Bacteroidota bacterium]